MAGIWKKLAGTTATFFQFGIGKPAIKSTSNTELSLRDAADANLVDLRLNKAYLPSFGGSYFTSLEAGIANGSDLSFRLPNSLGSPSQVMATDGSGNLSFVTVAGGPDKPVVDTTTLAFNSTSPLTMFTLPANAIVLRVQVIIDTAFNGSPSMSVGISGTTSKYMGSNDVNLKDVAGTIYEVEPGLTANGSSENLIITYAAGGAAAGSARVLVEYVIPS